jgi:hypothetical protein
MANPRFGETLLTPSLVRLFGRSFTGLLLNEKDYSDTRDEMPYAPNQLYTNLSADAEGKRKPGLATIYGFSYEGNYYKMSAPAVFLVHGPGIDVTAGQDPIPLGVLGVEFKDEVFAADVKMWAYDKLDQVVRVDISSGWLEDLLLNCELGNASNVTGGTGDGGSDMVGRSQMTGRSQLVGRSQMIGRGGR